jgi:uncharacterized protein (TIGR02271 family)
MFKGHADAQRAKDELIAAGFDRDSVRITSQEFETAAASGPSGASARADTGQHEGIGERIGHFFRSLFGNEHDHDDLTEAVRRGNAVVTVVIYDENEANRAADILDERGAIDVQGDRAEVGGSAWAGSRRPAAAEIDSTAGEREGERVIPVVREELQVGKRRRQRGGVRIYSHMEQEEVQEEVRLRDEHARVERRPANRPATDADLAAFKEGTIEVRETVEEPVVAKRARVVEEVVVGKEISERTETVRDALRNDQVDVEQLDSTPQGTRSSVGTAYAGDYDNDYRTHWQTTYAGSGGRYEDYDPAYRYGTTLASDERYRSRSWNEIEPDARRDWESRNPGSAWEKFKGAAQHGWERVTDRR